MSSDILFEQTTLALVADNRVTFQTKTIDFRNHPAQGAYVRISPVAGQVRIKGPTGTDHETGLVIEGDDNAPNVRITNRGVDANELARTRVFVDGANGNLTLGGDGTDGDLVLRDANGLTMVHISGSTNLDRNVSQVVHPSAKLKINGILGLFQLGGLIGGQVKVENKSGTVTIELNGQTGRAAFDDVALTGSDAVQSLKAEIRSLRSRLDALER